MFLHIVIRSDLYLSNLLQTVMSNLNLKGTILFYTPYIHNYLQVTCEQTWRYDLHTLSLLQMQSLANSINFSHSG